MGIGLWVSVRFQMGCGGVDERDANQEGGATREPSYGRCVESDVRALSDKSYGLVKINGSRLRAPFGSPPNCLNDPFESIHTFSTYHGPSHISPPSVHSNCPVSCFPHLLVNVLASSTALNNIFP